MIQPHGVSLLESSSVEATAAAPAATTAAVLTEDDVGSGSWPAASCPVAGDVVPVDGAMSTWSRSACDGRLRHRGWGRRHRDRGFRDRGRRCVTVTAGFVIVGGAVVATGGVVAGTVGVGSVGVGAVVVYGYRRRVGRDYGIGTVGVGAVAVDGRVTEPAMSVLVTRVPLADDPPPHPARIPAETSASIDAPTHAPPGRARTRRHHRVLLASHSDDEGNALREPEPRPLRVIPPLFTLSV